MPCAFLSLLHLLLSLMVEVSSTSVVMAEGSNRIAGLMSDLLELLGQQYLAKADSRIISSSLLHDQPLPLAAATNTPLDT